MKKIEKIVCNFWTVFIRLNKKTFWTDKVGRGANDKKRVFIQLNKPPSYYKGLLEVFLKAAS